MGRGSDAVVQAVFSRVMKELDNLLPKLFGGAVRDGKVQAGSVVGTLPTTVQQAISAANLSSGAAADGTVLTADGAGGVAFEVPPAGGVVDAADVTYTPTTAADWDGDADPGDVDAALDQLAARATDLEATGGGADPSTFNLTGPYASLPAAGTAGRIYLPTDSNFDHLRDTGAAWEHFRLGKKCTPPRAADFTWMNQGTTTVSEAGGDQYWYAPAQGVNHHLLSLSLPSTPFTFKIGLKQIRHTATSAQFGLCLTGNATTDKLVSLIWLGSTRVLEVQRWNSFTSWNGNYATYNISPLQFVSEIWLAIEDDGTNRKCYASGDKDHLGPALHTVGRTDWTTPTRIGFGVDTENQITEFTVLHWEVV